MARFCRYLLVFLGLALVTKLVSSASTSNEKDIQISVADSTTQTISTKQEVNNETENINSENISTTLPTESVQDQTEAKQPEDDTVTKSENGAKPKGENGAKIDNVQPNSKLPALSQNLDDGTPKTEKLPEKRKVKKDGQSVQDIKNRLNKKALSEKEQVKGYIRDDGTYVVEDSSGMPCILAYFKSKITVYYPTDNSGEKYSDAVLRPPSDVDVSGKCDRDSWIAVLDLTWDQGIFRLRFAFDDLTDSWFVERFSFLFDTSMSAYKKTARKENVELVSKKNRRFWTTSHAKSFRCFLLHDVSLLNDNETYSATIHFDEARVQALTRTKTFKMPKHCIHRVHRSEVVPAVVTSSLIACSLLTIAGYAIFRHFKVKKFQYGTME